MEKIEEYRHFVDSKIKKLFINSLKKAIKKIDSKKIGFIGVIGSLKEKQSHDIDILIFPNLNTKIGESIIEIAKLYDIIDSYLKKYHERYYIAASPKKAMQEIIYYLAAIEEGSPGLIPVHSLFFTNYKDFKKFNPKNFEKEMKKQLITLHGNFDIIKKLPILSQSKLEPYFFILDFEMTSRIKTFPKHLTRASAESLFEYLKNKYNIKTKKSPHKIPEIQKEFKRLIETLDEKTYS